MGRKRGRQRAKVEFRNAKGWPCEPPFGWVKGFKHARQLHVGDTVYVVTTSWRVVERRWFAGLTDMSLVVVLQDCTPERNRRAALTVVADDEQNDQPSTD